MRSPPAGVTMRAHLSGIDCGGPTAKIDANDPTRNASGLADGCQVACLLTDPSQFDILQSGSRRGGPNAVRSIEKGDFITLLGGTAVAWPFGVFAQQAK